MSAKESIRELESTLFLKKLLKEYFTSFFSNQKKVAWCSSVGPAEILLSMGFQVYFPENHGALLGTSRMSTDLIPVANALGYSPDICSYLTSDVGAYLKKQTPLTKAYGIPSVPKPDVLVYSTNQCREVQDWFSFYSKEFNVPAMGVFSPWKVDELKSDQIAFVKAQFNELIHSLEPIAGEKLDMDRLREVVGLSAKASGLWKKFLAQARHSPSPITFFDGCIQMAPAVMLRGTKAAVDYYEALNQEVEARVSAGLTSVPDEKIRIYWDGMPIWGKLRFFSELFSKFQTCVVASTYCNSWVFDRFDINDPLGSLAEGYTQIFINRSETKKEEILKQIVDSFSVDGIIYHDAKTCPYNSNNRFGMPQRMQEKYGMPYLVINGDLNDLRCFSEEQTLTAVESFIEQLKESKRV